MPDSMMREYLLDHGAVIREDGVIEIPKRMERLMKIGTSIRRPGVRTLTIPSVHGLTLLYEGQHWVIR